MMKRLFKVALLLLLPTSAMADVSGVWRSEADGSGSYLEVTIGPCDSDPAETCGVISKAFTADGEDPDYRHLGKVIVDGMTADGPGEYSGGTIWDPVSEKTYDSKMKLIGDNELDVDGCVAIFCEGQAWRRVQ